MTAPRRSVCALTLGCLLALGCSNATNTSPPFAFNRPEHVAFTCIDPGGSARDSARPLVLPLRCCAIEGPIAKKDSEFTYECDLADGATPSLHALVTQSTRGEVAAVDLVEGEVLDSDLLVPGYTFVDVGGLPNAIVVPATRPFGSDDEGPPWTYVASAEELHVRAVATCRFREGENCGPERASANRDLDALSRRSRVPLPSAPKDMILGPDNALWVTLPEVGLVARIELSPKVNDPFAMTESGAAPRDPTFFALPPPGDIGELERFSEDPEYLAVCGLGHAFEELSYTLPFAPESSAGDAARPTRLRYDDTAELLLVADAVAPVVRAFAIEDGALVPRGTLETGAPVRDFVVTPEVPETIGKSDLVDTTEPPSFSGEPQKRYLYAVDDRDGSLMALEYAYDDALLEVSAKLLLVPGSGYVRRYEDRVDLDGSVVNALEIIDTRVLTDEPCGFDESVSRQRPLTVENFERRVDAAAAAVERARKDYESAGSAAERAAAQKVLRAAEFALEKADARSNLLQGAGATQLRGVFVAAVTSDGGVRIVDVHDLDLFCRAALYCGDKDETVLREDVDNATAVAVRRHTARLSGPHEPVGAVTDVSELAPLTCPEGYTRVLEANASEVPADDKADALVCSVASPWRAVNQAWSVSFQGAIPQLSLSSAALELSSDGQLELWAPAGVDLCERGAVSRDAQLEIPNGPFTGGELPRGRYKGDAIVIVSEPSQAAPENCPSPNPQDPRYLPIAEAFQDHLVLDVSEQTARTLLRCYPDLVSYETRTQDAFTVLGSPALYLHNMSADADGRCVIDPDKDELLGSRVALPASGDEVSFQNPYLAFTLKVPAGQESTITPIIQVTGFPGKVVLAVFDPSVGRTDTRPTEVRYFPYTNDLFVVDSASQGLRRFSVTPFATQSTSFR